MKNLKPLPPVADVLPRLSYDPETGVFRWKLRVAMRVQSGELAGSVAPNGYLRISICNSSYGAHRLAWLIFYGEDPGCREIDHINGNTLDNRIKNLRLATHSQNQFNRERYANNTSGYKGVSWDKRTTLWMAHVQFHKQQYRCYGFMAPEAAYEWVCAKREELHAEFANHGAPAADSATVAAATTADHFRPCELLKN